MNNAPSAIDYDLIRERAHRLRHEAIGELFLRLAATLRKPRPRTFVIRLSEPH